MRKANHSLFLFFSVCSWAHLTARGQPLFPGVGSRKQTRASPCQQAAAPPPHRHSLIPSLTHDFEPGSHSFRAKLVLNLCSPASASQGMGLHLCTIILKISSFLCVCMCRFSELIFQLAYKIMGSIMVLSCMYHIWCWFIALPRSASRPTAPQPHSPLSWPRSADTSCCFLTAPTPFTSFPLPSRISAHKIPPWLYTI